MSENFTVACVQNCAGPDMRSNLVNIESLVRAAAGKGAALVCLPEFFSCLDVRDGVFEVGALPDERHPAVPLFQDLAKELGVWIQMGSIASRSATGSIRNRAYVIDGYGTMVAHYDKIHLFDIDLLNGECYRESETVDPGELSVVANSPWGTLGLSVCYDLRFAYLYRALAHAGADFMIVPAAFAKTTGEAHWHVLLRARAIETGSYVFAACQYGTHGEAESYGHSLIVDPWGRILADGGEGPGIILAEIDPSCVRDARRMIPALRHDREFSMAANDSTEFASAAEG